MATLASIFAVALLLFFGAFGYRNYIAVPKWRKTLKHGMPCYFQREVVRSYEEELEVVNATVDVVFRSRLPFYPDKVKLKLLDGGVDTVEIVYLYPNDWVAYLFNH